MKKVPNILVIGEQDWDSCIYKTREWEQSVIVDKWTHDYELKQYIIAYFEKEKPNNDESEL